MLPARQRRFGIGVFLCLMLERMRSLHPGRTTSEFHAVIFQRRFLPRNKNSIFLEISSYVFEIACEKYAEFFVLCVKRLIYRLPALVKFIRVPRKRLDRHQKFYSLLMVVAALGSGCGLCVQGSK